MPTVIEESADRLVVVTDVGPIGFCSITGPGVKKVKSDKKIYKVAKEVTKDEKKEILKLVTKYFKEYKPKGFKGSEPSNLKNIVYKSDADGKLYISPWTPALRADSDEPVEVPLIDAKKNPLSKKEFGKIGAGSTGRVSINFVVYGDADDAGVSVYLNGLQLQHFVPYSGGGGAKGLDEIDGDALTSGSGFEGEKKKKKKKKKEGK